MNTPVKPKYRILAVDDDVELNSSFKLLMELDGHEVQTAATSEAAFDLLAKHNFDLMLTEYWLPHLKGDQLAALVKQKWPDLPIIMVTANLEEFNTDQQPVAGVDCLLDKPFSMDHLRQAIHWAIERAAKKRSDALEHPWVPSLAAEAPDTPQAENKEGRLN